MDHASKTRSSLPREAGVRGIRPALGLARASLAAASGGPSSPFRDGERGQARPEGAARSHRLVVESRPEAVREALTAA